MNILYVGNEIKGNFIKEISKKDKIVYTGSYNRVAEYEDIIFQNSYDIILFDVDNLIDESLVIKDYIIRVEKAKNTKIIIVAIGYSYHSELISILVQAGFKNFIFGTSLSVQYDEYNKCLSGYFDNTEIESLMEEPETEEKKQEKTLKKFKTIGIAGVLPRIGNTTICLQLIKYIKSKGYNAAYVEINSSNYIESCEKLYANVLKDKEGRYIIYNNINLYNGSDINEVINSEYNFIICDYGDITNPSFNKISFIEKDIKIFVAGSKPNEFQAIQPVLQSQVYSDAKFIFNFVPDADKEDIKEMMCEKASDTIFTVYSPEPFDYIYNPDFEKLLPLEININNKTSEQKKHFSLSKLLRGK